MESITLSQPVSTSLRYAILILIVSILILTGQVSHAAPGDLDTTFGTGGLVTQSIDIGDDEVNAIAVLPDGKILVAGRSRRYDAGIMADLDFALVRYNADGTLDTTFDTDGIVTTDLSGDETANAVVVLDDGSILLAGRGSGTFVVAKYTPTGALDTSFGSGTGYASINPDVLGNDSCLGMAVSPQGKITLVGDADISGHYEIALAQFNADGTVDTSFGGGDGLVVVNAGATTSNGHAIAIQPDGFILVAGDADGTGFDFALLRFDPSGNLDTTFDTDGILLTDIGGFNEYGHAMALQPDGKILVAGESFTDTGSGFGYHFAVARYLTNGTLDSTFGTGGISVTNVLADTDKARAIAVQPDGKIIVGGFATNSVSGNDDLALARLNSDGSPDTGFGTGGVITTAIGGITLEAETGFGVAIQPNGKVLLAQSNNYTGSYKMIVARYLAIDSDNNPATAEPWDITPDAFAFTDITGATTSSLQTSDIITVSGLGTGVYVPVTVTGGEFEINGGTYTTDIGYVTNGDQLSVRHISAPSINTQTDTVLTIGGLNAPNNTTLFLGTTQSDTFSSTTAQDLTPDAFSFTDQTNVALSSIITSNSITVSGITAATAISITGGEYAINGGSFVTTAGTVVNGDTVQVRHTSASAELTAVDTTLTIGGVSDIFTSTTADLTPAAFSFTDQIDVTASTLITSNSITVSGITAATAISITGGEYAINGGGFVTTAGTVVNGDTVQVRHTSASAESTAVNTTLTIGGVSDIFTSTTADLTPAAFSFTDQIDVALSTLTTSNSITVSGITAATAISITGGEYAINGGGFVTTAGTVVNGDTVQVRHTSSSAESTAVNTTLTIGGVSDIFTSTTADLTPAAFSFTDQIDVALSTLTTSNSITVSGITAATAISITGGEYAINGGGFVTTAGTVVNGDTVQVRHTSASAELTAVNTTLTIGGVSDIFTSTTADLTPVAFSFTDQTNVALSSIITSNSITVSGITGATAISITGGEYAINGGSFVTTAGTVVNGDTVQVRHTSSSAELTAVDTTLTIGGVSDIFTSTTADLTPAAFSFTDLTDVALSTLTTSNSITVSGITGAAAISITGGEYAINGGGFVATAGTVVNGDTVQVRHTSSSAELTPVNTTLTIGGVSDIFTSTTADLTPVAFSFTDQTNVMPGTTISSNAITVSGITGATAISITGGEYAINGGGFVTTAGTVINGDTVQVRHTSSSAELTAVNTTLTIGGVSDIFTSTTADLTPAAFSFTDQIDVALSTLTTSDSITVSGITAATAISITGGEYAINGGVFVTTAGTVLNGDTVQVRHTSSSAELTAVDTTLTIGGVSDIFTSTTADLTPAAFSFTDQTDVALSTIITSDSITVSGITAATAISITGGEYAINGGSFVTTAGTVVNGDTVQVRHTSSSAELTAVNTTLTIGGVSDTFTSTTADLTPSAFGFIDQTNVTASTLITSNSITVAGLTGAAAISITGGEYAINGGGFVTTSGTVVNGDTVQVRHTSASAESTAVNTTLTIGGVSDTFTSTTADLTPDAFSFTDLTNVMPGTTSSSNIITVSGRQTCQTGRKRS